MEEKQVWHVTWITSPKPAIVRDQLGCRVLSLNLESQTFQMRATWIKLPKHKALSSSIQKDRSVIIKSYILKGAWRDCIVHAPDVT